MVEHLTENQGVTSSSLVLATTLTLLPMSSTPTRIRRRDPSKVILEWADGRSTEFDAADLRRRCPCAACVSETTGQRILDPTSIPDDLTQENLRLVGNYAICLRFSDGHETGIYTFEFLHRAGQPD